MNNSLLEVDRLQSLVDNILFAAKIERNDHGFLDEQLDVSVITVQAAENVRLNKKGVKIETDIQPDIVMQLDPLGFTSAVINLLENAVKYSPEGSTVKVSLKQKDTTVFLKVEDQGCGIPEEEHEKVFEKFYRIGNEDTRRAKGTGLGLYIVKRFVDIYKGSISINNNLPCGTIFEIKLPLH
jgi:signal transduction histidine kinase